jgi:hypothetical protein
MAVIRKIDPIGPGYLAQLGSQRGDRPKAAWDEAISPVIVSDK